MNLLNAELGEKARRVVFIQLLTTLVVAAVFFVFGAEQGTEPAPAIAQRTWDALSAAYGGMSSVALALISIWGFRRANATALSDPKQSMMILYIGAVARFAAVLILLGIGLGLLKLQAIAVFIGFALAQASYLMGVRDRKAARTPD